MSAVASSTAVQMARLGPSPSASAKVPLEIVIRTKAVFRAFSAIGIFVPEPVCRIIAENVPPCWQLESFLEILEPIFPIFGLTKKSASALPVTQNGFPGKEGSPLNWTEDGQFAVVYRAPNSVGWTQRIFSMSSVRGYVLQTLRAGREDRIGFSEVVLSQPDSNRHLTDKRLYFCFSPKGEAPDLKRYFSYCRLDGSIKDPIAGAAQEASANAPSDKDLPPPSWTSGGEISVVGRVESGVTYHLILPSEERTEGITRKNSDPL